MQNMQSLCYMQNMQNMQNIILHKHTQSAYDRVDVSPAWWDIRTVCHMGGGGSVVSCGVKCICDHVKTAFPCEYNSLYVSV